ncbi:MAG: dihydroxy-acid dehydratase [Marivivens sp.]|uniref:dihydroxy-acid dehydratase n=1 Tax=Marivivens sp. TaxID=1978374 RepID=UPI0017FFF90F|nr:dihydroxy-acid dehydratase [Marivivens sp.]NVJ94304.1 dihydroxy-acid dehydratase [Marivivens sp.]
MNLKMRVLAAFWGASLLVSACTLDGGLASGPKSIDVLGGEITVAAPEGYCFDQRASRLAEGFTVATPCGASRLALITTQIGEAASAAVAGAENALLQLIQHPDGRALLSGAGDPSTIFVHHVQVHNHRVEVFFSDTASSLSDGLQPTQWRAFLDYQDRMVTVSVRWWDQSPLDQAQGLAVLRAAALALVGD